MRLDMSNHISKFEHQHKSKTIRNIQSFEKCRLQLRFLEIRLLQRMNLSTEIRDMVDHQKSMKGTMSIEERKVLTKETK